MQLCDYQIQLSCIQQPYESKPPLKKSQLLLIGDRFVPIFIGIPEN
jgi:hypothetical protein